MTHPSIDAITGSATARKARMPETGDFRYYRIRRDLNQGAQVRLAKAIARREPYEPEPLRRGKTFTDGLVNAVLAWAATLPDGALEDGLVTSLAMAGLGASVTQSPDDGAILATAILATLHADPRLREAVAAFEAGRDD